jgi:hypothetical protein
MSIQEQLNSLYEELIYWDEIAGEFSEDTNFEIDLRRDELVEQIKELEKQQ